MSNVQTSSKLLDLLARDSAISDTYTTTENGALALKSSGSEVLNFFSRAAAMRGKPILAVSKLFNKAIKENLPLALAALFYARDIRHGQGERELFRQLINIFAKNFPEQCIKLVPFLPEYGRWDDLFCLKGTKPYLTALDFIKLQLIEDAEALRTALPGEPVAISLCAKWMPSEKAGKKSKQLSYELARSMHLTMTDYRRFMSVLRQHLQIVETKMCQRKWNEIDYSKLPSVASLMYRKAFKKRDRERYLAYIESVKKGEKKINATTLYPYQIVESILNNNYGKRDETLEQLWNALPNYIGEEHSNSIAVVDTSSSMYGKPITVAISLGMYLAERNKHSAWKDHFISFQTSPQLIKIRGDNFTERVRNVYTAPWGGSTNLVAVFELILDKAKKGNLSQKDLPGVVYIISDMEFDSAANVRFTSRKTTLETIDSRFKSAGYERPKLVFWNVDSRNEQSPAAFDETGVALFSGLSPTIFKAVLTGTFNPLTIMLDTLLSERYEPIISALK